MIAISPLLPLSHTLHVRVAFHDRVEISGDIQTCMPCLQFLRWNFKDRLHFRIVSTEVKACFNECGGVTTLRLPKN